MLPSPGDRRAMPPRPRASRGLRQVPRRVGQGRRSDPTARGESEDDPHRGGTTTGGCVSSLACVRSRCSHRTCPRRLYSSRHGLRSVRWPRRVKSKWVRFNLTHGLVEAADTVARIQKCCSAVSCDADVANMVARFRGHSNRRLWIQIIAVMMVLAALYVLEKIGWSEVPQQAFRINVGCALAHQFC